MAEAKSGSVSGAITLAMSFEGIVVVVSGASKGIGYACASCLGHEGCKVVVADIDEQGSSR